MNLQGQHARSGSSLVILLIVFAAYSVLILTTYHYERLTGDATLYLSIAEKYLQGDLNNAINGYWGPLLSWLLVPFLYSGATHLFAINALNLIFGLLTIAGIWKLSFRFEISDTIRGIILIPLVPILQFISLIQPMDFLLLCILIYYLNIVFDKNFPVTFSSAAAAGILGALAYFSKPYGFPFFISHFILINICHYFATSSKEHRQKVLRGFITGAAIFALLSGTWIGLISNKYGHFTFSNMGKGVFSGLGPGSLHKTLEKGDPIFFEGFFPPPNETAFIIYEDPSHARINTWSPLESKSSFRHYINNIIENIFEGIRIYESYSRLAIAIIIAYILSLFSHPLNRLLSQRALLYPLLTILLYTGGYMPFHFESRYLWIINILLLLMGGKILNELFQYDLFKKRGLKIILTILLILSFSFTPLKASIEMGNENINREMYKLGIKLDDRYNIHGNIASNRYITKASSHDSWHRTFRLAYWTKSRYYGQPQEGISDAELRSDLIKHDIDYYFSWEGSDESPGFLSEYREITNSEIPGLKIYSLKE
jgi:hypothetical protein